MIEAARRRFQASPVAARSAMLVLAAMAFYSVNALIIRYLVLEVPAVQAVFITSLFGVLAMAPWLTVRRFRPLRTRQPKLHLARGGCMLIGYIGWFLATEWNMPISDITAVSFLTPLFATVMAVVFLKEQVGIRRTAAAVIGFAGAFIILRPGMGAFQWASLLVVASSFAVAATFPMGKQLLRTDSPDTTVVYIWLVVTPLAFVLTMMLGWQPMSWTALGLAAASAAAGITGARLHARGVQIADVSYIALFEYTRLPFVAALSFVAFRQVSDFWTWFGAIIIAGAGAYIVHRETVLGLRKARA